MTSSRMDPVILAALLGGAALLLSTRRGSAAVSMPARAGRDRARRRSQPRCRVVVVGAGFGGLNAALRLAGKPGIDLTVIDAHNHHLFQPFLYQVATAALSPSDIASPIRGIIPVASHAKVLMETVTGIDTAARRVTWDGGSVPYDELIVATGSQPSYFGHDDWAQAAPGLKTLEDASKLCRRILLAFEKASVAEGQERQRLLTFALIGGGATGVEMAGSIAELARDLLKHDYDMPGAKVRVVLVEAGERVLPEFTPDLSRNAAKALQGLGVEIRAGTRVTGIEDGLVRLHGETLAAETVIWTAGTMATPVADWLGVEPSHGGRVSVDAGLSLAGHPGIHVIGDASQAVDARGKPLPGLAAVAKQQGRYVANAILRRVRSGRETAGFSYRDYGTLATIGRGRAVAEFGRLHLTGEPAWLIWAAAHIFFLIGFRHRVMVSTQWAFAYATRQRTNRIILDGAGVQPPVAKPG